METPGTDTTDFGEMEKAYNERSKVWETNHVAITRAMIYLIRKNERWPTKAEIADETGLSRPTVYVHMVEFDRGDVIGSELGEFKFMSSQILARLMESAMEGDIKAIRLAFEVTGILKKGKGPGNTETQRQGTAVRV